MRADSGFNHETQAAQPHNDGESSKIIRGIHGIQKHQSPVALRCQRRASFFRVFRVFRGLNDEGSASLRVHPLGGADGDELAFPGLFFAFSARP